MHGVDGGGWGGALPEVKTVAVIKRHAGASSHRTGKSSVSLSQIGKAIISADPCGWLAEGND